MIHWFEKFHGTTGEPSNLGVSPLFNYYEDIPLISPVTYWWPNTFHVQYPPFFFKIYHSSEFYRKVNHDYLRGEFAYWEDVNNDPAETMWTAYGTHANVHDKVFGCGAGHTITDHNGYYGTYATTSLSTLANQPSHNPDKIFSVPIMAGALLAARSKEESVKINEKLKYLWDEKACAYTSGYTPSQHVLFRCSITSDLPIRSVTAIDYGEIIAGYLYNYLPQDFFHKYGVSIGDFDVESPYEPAGPGFELVKGNIEKELTLEKQWYLSFDFKLAAVTNGQWVNVVRVGPGVTNNAQHGDRSPGVFFNPGSSKLHIHVYNGLWNLVEGPIM